MRRKSLNLSGKIDPLTIELFEDIKKVAGSMDIQFFVVGATARDMILTYGYDIQTTRATMDIDFGVQVADWDQYEKLKHGLIDTTYFKQEPRKQQRLIYKDDLMVDVIPFGTIADPEHRFSWPKEDGIEMDTLGFIDSYEDALLVRLRESPVLDIRFASLAGLALMKMIAWEDNPARGSRDAKDIKLIIHNYLDAGNVDRVFEEESDIFDKIDKNIGDDYKIAGARLLGRDIAKIAIPESKHKIIEILEAETGEKGRYKLVEEMIDTLYKSSHDLEDNIELLEQVKLGVLDEEKE
jgi:predicted nucleotidyltransferase